MRHEIKVVFDTSNGLIELDTGETESAQAANILLAAVRKLRQDQGVLQVVVTKDTKTQIVTTDFQADEILQWGELLGMLEQAKCDAGFKQYFQMFINAQQMMAKQAMAAQQNAAIMNQVNGGRLKL